MKLQISNNERELDFEIAKETIIPLIYRGVREIAQRIYNFKWKIIYIHSQGRGFVTSDNPFFAIPDGRDFENMSLRVSLFVYGVRFIASFTPNICIFMREGENDLDLQVPFHHDLNKINKLMR